jgi:hypothetical protein
MAPVHRTGVAEGRPFGRYEEPNIIRRRGMGDSGASCLGEIKSLRPTGLCGDGSLTRLDGSKTRPHIFPYTICHGLDFDCCLDILGSLIVCLGFLWFEFFFVPGVVA